MVQGDTEGSVYQLKSGKYAGQWVGALVVGWKANGRPDRKTRMRPTEKEARKALRELLNQRDDGKLKTKAEDWTVAEWMPHWLAGRRDDPDDDLAVSTIDDYDSLIRTWITPRIGTTRLDLIRPTHEAKIQKAMKAAGRSASRRHHVHVLLHAALAAAVRDGRLGYNPLQGVEAPTVPRAKIRPQEREDVEAIYQEIVGDRLEARWLVALVLGLRQGEALGLEWKHVDLDAGTVLIQQQLRRTRGKHGCGPQVPAPVNGKPKRTAYPCGRRWASKCPSGDPGVLTLSRVKTERGNRTMPLTPDLVAILRRLQSQQQLEERAAGKAYQRWETKPVGERRTRPVDPVFRTSTGSPIEPRADWQAWTNLLDRAGLQPTRLHNARHSAAVALLDAGVPLALLGRLMGHASDAFAMQTYGHFSKEAANAARDLMAAHHGALRAPKRPNLTVLEQA